MLSGMMLFDGERHAAALDALTLQALSAGDLAQAFKFADRRCRIPPIADAHHYTLRAEIAYRMGFHDEALADIARAIEIEPENLSANRRLLGWGNDQAQVEAATRLLTIEHDLDGIASAIAVLRRAGGKGFAAISATDDAIKGWAVWSQSARARITVEGETGNDSAWLEPDLQHPLACEGFHAASFTHARPRSRTSQLVSLYAGKTLLRQSRLRPNADVQRPRLKPKANPHRTASRAVTIIVPVFADFAATSACFDSLQRELADNPKAHVIVVDDASHDARIKKLIRALSRKPKFRLLTNEQNLGFAASVNRALAEAGHGDIILLNADTVVPPGFIGRLQAAAHSAPDIGTVTPLSNNGEFTSFPVAFRLNPLGSYQEVCAIDAAAARANAEQVIDMPNGTGFCLYVTRACLDAIGNLSEAFHRGYFEDVDLCLRGREFGFRNVCAAAVYVGHAGTRSFGAEKRALVMKNLATIDQRFPRYRPECAAFVNIDPLRPARMAIERAIAAPIAKPTLLVTGPGLIRAIVDARAADLVKAGEPASIVEIRVAPSGALLRVVNPTSGVPQSLTFNFADPAERSEALDYFLAMAPTRIEVADPAAVNATVMTFLLQLQCPLDLFIADAGLLCPRGNLTRPDGNQCDAPQTGQPCEGCLNTMSVTDWIRKRDRLLETARKIYVPDGYAEVFASRIAGYRKLVEIKPHKRKAKTKRPAKNWASGKALGLIAVGADVAEYRRIQDMARTLNRELPERPIVVIGATIDDLALMRLDNVHVTGNVQAAERDQVLRQYDIGALVVPIQRPLFGHPAIAGFAGRAPTASFDWSFGDVSPHPGDLALDPQATSSEINRSLVSWLSGM